MSEEKKTGLVPTNVEVRAFLNAAHGCDIPALQRFIDAYGVSSIDAKVSPHRWWDNTALKTASDVLNQAATHEAYEKARETVTFLLKAGANPWAHGVSRHYYNSHGGYYGANMVTKLMIKQEYQEAMESAPYWKKPYVFLTQPRKMTYNGIELSRLERLWLGLAPSVAIGFVGAIIWLAGTIAGGGDLNASSVPQQVKETVEQKAPLSDGSLGRDFSKAAPSNAQGGSVEIRFCTGLRALFTKDCRW